MHCVASTRRSAWPAMSCSLPTRCRRTSLGLAHPGDELAPVLDALAGEAADYIELVRSLEHGWAAARARVPAQRSTSRAALAIDVLAAAPLLSATTLDCRRRPWRGRSGCRSSARASCWSGSWWRRLRWKSRTGRRDGSSGCLGWRRCATPRQRRAGRCPGVAVVGRPSRGIGRLTSSRLRCHSRWSRASSATHRLLRPRGGHGALRRGVRSTRRKLQASGVGA